MTCVYCRATNAEDDHRCHRCGRRLRPAPHAAAMDYHSRTATALRIEAEPEPIVVPEAPPREVRPPQRSVVYQRPLFSSKEVPQVIGFETFAPVVPERPRQRASEPQRPRTRRPIPGQQTLEFNTPLSHEIDGQAEPVIYCDAPVAIPAHRMIAAAADCSLILIALGIFIGIFQFAGGNIMVSKQTLPLLAGIAAVFTLVYKLLWCLADGDTAGMRWAHLKLVNFDGQRPDREQRVYRMASGILSLLAAGLGVIWALVDEESLTWHDHISKTFPTPY